MPLFDPPDPAACPWEHVELAFAGDIMAHSDQVAAARRPDGTYDFSAQFEAIAPWISAADLAMANFETVMDGPATGWTSFPQFNTPDALADAVAAAGFDLVQTANNHCIDRGVPGLFRTLDVLDRAGLRTVGTRSSPTVDGWVTLEADGMTVAVVAGTFSLNGNYIARDQLWAATPLGDVAGLVDRVRPRADLVVAGAHWGWEYETRPRSGEIGLARDWVDHGADVVWAHHPHVVQPVERVGDALVAYSHGNLVSGQRTFPRGGGLITRVDVAFCPVTREARFASVSLLPTWVDVREGRHAVFRVVPADPAWIASDGRLTDQDLRDVLKYRKHLDTLLPPELVRVDPPGVAVRREEVAWAFDPTGMARAARFARGVELSPSLPADP